MMRQGPLVGVVVFPGSNDELDAVLALQALGADAVLVPYRETALPPIGAVVLPGGFSYGDYLRCGAIARFAPIMGAVTRFAAGGGLVLGICNGFQILCEAGLLPGALTTNADLDFVCRDAWLDVGTHRTPFTSGCPATRSLRIPVKHGAGRYVADEALLARLERERRIVLRYGAGDNPNGSTGGVAGIVNEQRNVMGMMPHPEHAVDPLLGSADGAYILASLVDAARERALSEAA